MVEINRIDVRVSGTASAEDPKPDGSVYLGLGGREFCLDTNGNDHEPGTQIYVLGDGTNLINPGKNDPRNPQLGTVRDLAPFPVYIRKGANGDDEEAWRVESVRVTVNPGPYEVCYERLFGSPRICLSSESGQVLYLKHL